jgi:hypothetical protein
MNDKELEYWATEITDAELHALADAGDFFLGETAFQYLPTQKEMQRLADEGSGGDWEPIPITIIIDENITAEQFQDELRKWRDDFEDFKRWMRGEK